MIESTPMPNLTGLVYTPMMMKAKLITPVAMTNTSGNWK